MKILGRLSLAAVITAYAEVLLGSWTRINGAGMTCPDYPLCHGVIVPAMGGGTVWEWTHRLLAATLSLVVIAVLYRAYRARREAPFITPLGLTIALLFAFQVFLGAATVHLSNSPISVVWHWGTAMLFVASLTILALLSLTWERRESAATSRVLAGGLAGTAFVAFVTMCIGAYVSSSGAGLACLDIPQCAGNVVVYTQGQYVQMLHRFVAAAALLSGCIVFALAWLRETPSRVRIMTSIGFALLIVQVMLGLLNVALRLPIDLREAHAANAALLFLAFICAAAFAAFEERGEYVSAR